MSRIHLFEWEDQNWFPSIFRNFITDHLVFHSKRLYDPVIPLLTGKLRQTGYRNIVDLCSGSGGPLQTVVPQCADELHTPIEAKMTDLFPNLDAFQAAHTKSEGAIGYLDESVNAMDCPKDLNGFRTMFTALHHFKPDEVQSILSDAANKRVPIGVFECTERSLFNATLTPIAATLSAFLLTPFLGSMSLARAIFTYLIPLAPFFLVWDGFVSALRTYSPKELESLTRQIDVPGYRWEIGKVSAFGHIGPYNITYLFGVPTGMGAEKRTHLVPAQPSQPDLPTGLSLKFALAWG